MTTRARRPSRVMAGRSRSEYRPNAVLLAYVRPGDENQSYVNKYGRFNAFRPGKRVKRRSFASLRMTDLG